MKISDIRLRAEKKKNTQTGLLLNVDEADENIFETVTSYSYSLFSPSTGGMLRKRKKKT